MRTIGVDLAISATHKAVAADEQAKTITPLLSQDRLTAEAWAYSTWAA